LTDYVLHHLVIDYTFYQGTPIFCAIDSFTKKLWAWICPTKEARHVIKYLKQIVAECEMLPTRVRSDNGKEFKNEEVHALVEKAFGAQYRHGAVARPQTQGVVERPNRTIKNGLDYETIRGGGRTLKQRLERTIAAYNSRLHSTTKMVPDEAFKQTKFMNPTYDNTNTTMEEWALASLITEKIQANAKARAHLNKKAHDRRKDPKSIIQVGDIIYHVKTLRDGVRHRRGVELTYTTYQAIVLD
jgi:transposase InsO family protein